MTQGSALNDDDFRRAEEALWSEIQRHNHTIYGNGTEGLTTRISLIEHAISSIQEMTRQRRATERAILLIVAGLALRDLWAAFGHAL